MITFASYLVVHMFTLIKVEKPEPFIEYPGCHIICTVDGECVANCPDGRVIEYREAIK